MDERFRAELLELNELHWKRFEAFMDARFAAADLKMEQRFAVLDAAFDARMNAGCAAISPRFVALDAQFVRFEARMDRLFDEQIRLMIVLWLATVIPLGGLMVGLFNSVR